jgi:penicillin-binding protein 1B
VRNVTTGEAATIAGVIQSPSRLSPFRNPSARGNGATWSSRKWPTRTTSRPADAEQGAARAAHVSSRALENEAPYFVDYVSQQVENDYAGLLKTTRRVDVYTTLDLHLQRIAQEAVGEAPRPSTSCSRPEAARDRADVAGRRRSATGEILAMVGGRAYRRRSTTARSRAAPAGLDVQAVRLLSAFERGAEEGRSDITPATIVVDEPTTFSDGDKEYAPATTRTNTTGRSRCGARWRCRATSSPSRSPRRSATTTSPLWKQIGVGTPPRPTRRSRSACSKRRRSRWRTAYTCSATTATSARSGLDADRRKARARQIDCRRAKPVARKDTTFLVTNMMRSVLNEGTGAAARAPRLHARRARQDRHDQRLCATPGSSASRRSC